MKKILCTLTLAMLLALSFATAAYASASNAGLDYVTDAAGLLTASDMAQLQPYAKQVSEEYSCGIYIVIVEDYSDYTYGDVRDCAEEIYTEYDLGFGASRDGVLLLLSMAERDYALIAYGDFANAAFTDYGKEVLADAFLDDFRNDNWCFGFEDYIEKSASMLEQAKNGTPLDVPYGSGGSSSVKRISPGAKIVFIVVVPCVISALVCLIFALSMKTARRRETAEEYVGSGDVNLRVKQDNYTHTTVSRTPLPKQSSSGGRGGGTSISSSGFSGRSGKF